MAQPIYFLPNVEARDLVKAQKLHRPVLQAAGIDELLADVVHEGDVAIMPWSKKGPGGHSGTFLCALKENPTRDIPEHWGFYPQHQKWEVRTPGLKTSAYIGWNPDQPPTPEDLRRKRMYGGYVLTLGDEQPWQVPIIRRPDDTTELPCHMHLGNAGELVERVKASYQRFFDELAIVHQWLTNRDKPDDEVGFSKRKAFDLAVLSLSINYRFDHAEQRIVQAVDRDSYLSILSAAVDWIRFSEVSEAAKKKPSPPGTESTTPGPRGGSPGTGPATPTSGS
jgi:hypothetical protein